jgi:hypothetical protein
LSQARSRRQVASDPKKDKKQGIRIKLNEYKYYKGFKEI